jgi:uncharacterized membrane protein YgcG
MDFGDSNVPPTGDDEFPMLSTRQLDRIAAATRYVESISKLGAHPPTGTARSVVAVVITSPAGGIGKYVGQLLLPPTNDISGSTNLALSDIGTTGSGTGVTCLVLNLAEINFTSGPPMLSDGNPKFGLLRQINQDGTLVVVIESVETNDETCGDSSGSGAGSGSSGSSGGGSS